LRDNPAPFPACPRSVKAFVSIASRAAAVDISRAAAANYRRDTPRADDAETTTSRVSHGFGHYQRAPIPEKRSYASWNEDIAFDMTSSSAGFEDLRCSHGWPGS
jgi:hypothetical protein